MRARIALLLAAVLASGLLLAGPPTAAGTADKVAIGYRIPTDGTAGGGWIGARKLWPKLVYRLDPGARRAATPGFGPAGRVEVLNGSGPRTVTRRDTARAAYILAAYGDRRSHAPQNAAVDAAIGHLLVGGRYALTGSRASARIRQSGHAAEIRFLADYMLRDSWDFAGPYAVRVTGRGADLGGTAGVTVRVTASYSHRPFATLPVTISVPGRAAVTKETDANGSVAIEWPATRAGWLEVKVRVAEVPETRLLVRKPTRRGASRVAIAGVKRVLAKSVNVPVRAFPTVSVTQPSVGRLGQPTTGSFTISDGVDSARTATVRAFGPFPTVAEATCSGTPVSSTSTSVSANGTYPVPHETLPRVGYYVWGVTVAANAVNAAASTCGTPYVVKSMPKLTVKIPHLRQAVGTSLRAWWTAARLPAGFHAPLTIRLYGPFVDADHVSCTGTTTRVAQVTLTGPASGWTTSYTPGKAGLYAWRTSLPGTEFSFPAATTCGGPYTMVRLVSQ